MSLRSNRANKHSSSYRVGLTLELRSHHVNVVEAMVDIIRARKSRVLAAKPKCTVSSYAAAKIYRSANMPYSWFISGSQSVKIVKSIYHLPPSPVLATCLQQTHYFVKLSLFFSDGNPHTHLCAAGHSTMPTKMTTYVTYTSSNYKLAEDRSVPTTIRASPSHFCWLRRLSGFIHENILTLLISSDLVMLHQRLSRLHTYNSPHVPSPPPSPKLANSIPPPRPRAFNRASASVMT